MQTKTSLLILVSILSILSTLTLAAPVPWDEFPSLNSWDPNQCHTDVNAPKIHDVNAIINQLPDLPAGACSNHVGNRQCVPILTVGYATAIHCADDYTDVDCDAMANRIKNAVDDCSHRFDGDVVAVEAKLKSNGKSYVKVGRLASPQTNNTQLFAW